MHKKFLKYCISIVVLLFSMTCSAKEPLKITGIKGSVNSTISTAVLKEAYQQIGMEIEYIPLPGARSLHTSNSGEVDGELFRIKNVEKKFTNLIPVPTPINILEAVVYSQDKSTKIKSWEDLRKYKIGIQVGIKFDERGTAGMDRIMVDTNEQLFRMLSAGRVDIAVVARTNGLKTLAKTKITNIYQLSPPIQLYPLYHYLHRKNQHLVEKLDKALIRMQHSGRIQQIRNSYLEKMNR